MRKDMENMHRMYDTGIYCGIQRKIPNTLR